MADFKVTREGYGTATVRVYTDDAQVARDTAVEVATQQFMSIAGATWRATRATPYYQGKAFSVTVRATKK